MTKAVRTFALLALLALALFAASPTIYNYTGGAGQVQIKPQAVPTSTTIVSTNDSYLLGITLINTTADTLTVTVASRESSPVQFLPTVAIAANTTYVINTPYGHWMPLGYTIVASGSGMVYYATWRQ